MAQLGTPRNTRHGIQERTSMRSLMVHEGQTHEHQQQLQQPADSNSALRTLNDSGTTGWKLPRRARTDEHYHAARSREGLSKGFAAFYGDDDATAKARDGYISSKQTCLVGDTARRHFEIKPTEEQQWKRGFKHTLPEILPPRPRGKAPVASVTTRPPFEEISDIPRGKKHVKAPENQLTGGGVPTTIAGDDSSASHPNNNNGDADTMSRKRVVMDTKRNVPVSWKGPPFFAPTEADETLFEGLRNRTVQRTEEQRRNGIPCKVPGDLPYKTVEEAPGYVQSINPKASKCGYEKPSSNGTSSFVFRDRFAAKESSMRRTQEITDVRSLPNY